MERGAYGVFFAPLSNRCVQDGIFESLALAPQPGSCRSDVLNDLVVDWDGSVLICCNDFQKQEVIGNLAKETIVSTLESQARKRVSHQLDTNGWSELATCSH